MGVAGGLKSAFDGGVNAKKKFARCARGVDLLGKKTVG